MITYLPSFAISGSVTVNLEDVPGGSNGAAGLLLDATHPAWKSAILLHLMVDVSSVEQEH